MTASRDPALQLLLDRAELHELMVRYAIAVDRPDFEAVAACFAPDVGGRFGPNDLAGRDGLIDYIRDVARFHNTIHMMGNQLIALRGDEAQVDTLAMLMHRATRCDGSAFRHDPSSARYSERPARLEGRWIFVARGAEPLWSADGVSPSPARRGRARVGEPPQLPRPGDPSRGPLAHPGARRAGRGSGCEPRRC